ncbi:MAG: hypothetical protein CMN30_29050 [Sandaracinus sp.]|nr:hypothetical protein [Sandaracinus sp.]|tara:strand:- start:123 stop:824 length:702 start_codon:yes stop_codon:yes gene_type:complete
MIRRGGAFLALALFALAGLPVEAERPTHDTLGEAEIPVRFRVAHIGGQPVKSAEWLAEQIATANRVFGVTGLSFRNVGVEPLDGDHAVLDDRHDRNQLGRYLERGAVNVFVVGEMRDVDNQLEWRRGVHWRLPWQPDRHFLVLTGIAPPTTLAHELGHFFGNRAHRWVPGNIMSYEHGAAPHFDPDQERRVVSTARTLLRSRQLFTAPTFDAMVAEGRLPSFFYPPHARRPER